MAAGGVPAILGHILRREAGRPRGPPCGQGGVPQLQDNADLKSQRANPATLQPGDVVFVPDKQTLPVTRASGARYPFTLQREGLCLRMTVLDATGQPMASAPCSVDVGSVSDTTMTGDDGSIEEPLDALQEDAAVDVGGLALEGAVGALDPFDTPSGVAERLRNLGYDVSSEDEDDYDETLRWAVEEFQCDRKRRVTGSADDVQTALRDAHGC